MIRTVTLLALLMVLGTGFAHAESFKCGKHFVEIGESKVSVLLHCGEPIYTEVISADDERKIEQWAYKGRGYRAFIRILTFDGGTLKHIKIGERAD